MQSKRLASQDVRMFQDDLYPRLAFTTDKSAFRADGPGARSFGKMFDLPSFAEGKDPDVVFKNLVELGKKRGLMDALDPRVTITNPLDANADPVDPTNPEWRNPDNANDQMTVGFTFLGQFLDHDITFDPAPLSIPPIEMPNLRSPLFDLDSLYGRGPGEDRILFDRSAELGRVTPPRFLIDFEAPRDLPRTSEQRAIIADPRNDENVIISQLHLAFLKFHNRVVDHVVAEYPDGDPEIPPEDESKPKSEGQIGREQFNLAKQKVLWHYQYIIVHQFLAASLDPCVLKTVLDDGPTIFVPSDNPAIPREFQVAAYRFGHSQIRPGYKINTSFGAPIFDQRIDPQEGDPNDLRGGRRAERRFVEWDIFFDFEVLEVAAVPASGEPDESEAVVRPKVKKNKRIDPFISTPMFELPLGPGLIDPGDKRDSLAGRNLLRHLMHELPSGQAIAECLGYEKLTPEDLKELTDLDFHESTPLWYYILKEALLQPGAKSEQQGQRLGKVGSRIVAEVFFGLLLSDPDSYWSRRKEAEEKGEKVWSPDLPRRDRSTEGDFTMVDLLTFAGVA